MAKDPAFFEDESVKDIAESHIDKVLSLEGTESDRVLRMYRKVRLELMSRLKALPEDRFTAQKTRGILLQVDSAIAAMTEGFGSDFNDSAEIAANTGISHLIAEINKWNKAFTGAVVPINIDAAAIATDTTNFLFSKYDASIERYSDLLRARMGQSLAESIAKEDSLSEIVTDIGKTFAGEEWKLLQISRTELHNVYNQAKLRGMGNLVNEDIPDLKKTLFHPMDKRTGEDSVWLSKHNPIIPVDEPFVEYSLGYRKEYQCPPNRPMDRAILIPYRRAWSKAL